MLEIMVLRNAFHRIASSLRLRTTAYRESVHEALMNTLLFSVPYLLWLVQRCFDSHVRFTNWFIWKIEHSTRFDCACDSRIRRVALLHIMSRLLWLFVGIPSLFNSTRSFLFQLLYWYLLRIIYRLSSRGPSESYFPILFTCSHIYHRDHVSSHDGQVSCLAVVKGDSRLTEIHWVIMVQSSET